MPDQYLFTVTGRIGPIIRACLPELTPTAEGDSTVLCGAVPDADGLQNLLDLLASCGCPPQVIRLTRRDDGTLPQSDSRP